MNRTIPIALTALLAAAMPRPAQTQTPPPRPAAPVPADGVAAGIVVPIQVLGDPAIRFSLVILGDGYTASEMGKFRAHVEKHLNIMWSLEPFRSYRNYINVYAVEVASPQSGITCDPTHREQRSTAIALYFDGGCTDLNARGVLVNQAAARRFASLATPAFDQVLVIANSDTYGGIGGGIATTTGGNTLSPYITPHELGHSLGRLQDEYTYSARGVMGPAYTGTEPTSVQHTILTETDMRAQQKKWWRWMGEPSEAGGTIGLYEGGQSRVSGIWRPSRHSMMISLGYYFDQVSRERLTQRISEQVELISASSPVSAGVDASTILWVETAHPDKHDLVVTWKLDGTIVPATANRRSLDLSLLPMSGGRHTVTATVVDPTSFVRDPVMRDTSFTATRTWNVVAATRPTRRTVRGDPVAADITASTQTARPVSGTDVVFVETTHPDDRVPAVAWSIDGRTAPAAESGTVFHLAQAGLTSGTHTLTATVDGRATRTWTIDNTAPTVAYTLGGAVTPATDADGTRHYTAIDSFTMKLEPRDDMPGYVVAEFRVNGDGWHHYYGWPDAPPGDPFRFTPRGTPIKELVYGSLSAEGLSPQPWEARLPGWGTHVIEYRARDAAGNVGEASKFRVTLQPSSK